MSQVYVVEDDSRSIRLAVQSITKEFPDANISVFTSPTSALQALESQAEHKTPPPDLIVLDLGFGSESGFEVLRFWKSSRSPVPIIVWTELDATYRDLCKFFGVTAVVPKLDGPQALITAMTAIKTAT